MASQETFDLQDLPADNASQLAIFDAMTVASTESTVVTYDELFDRVIGRLRVLVPRELYLAGDRAYVDKKVEACIASQIVAEVRKDGQRLFSLSGRPPRVRYPDGEIRDYTAGLELARERLDRDNARLRDARFDVRMHVPSIADEPSGPQFQALLASIREHGFLRQFPLVSHQDDAVIDGRARLLAAATLQLDVEYLKYGSEKDRTAAHRRDTPMNRILVALQCNAGRLSAETVDVVRERVAGVTGRAWAETVADLELTAEWRLSTPGEYTPVFEVKMYAYRDGVEAKIQVTADNKVMLRSLIEAAGLSNYKIDLLRDHVPFEPARTVHSGRKAMFARAPDLIPGIAAMQADRRTAKRKLDPEWEQIRDWLVATFPRAES